VANAFFLAVVGQLVLTWAVGVSGRMGRRLLTMTALLLGLTVAQIGLGYAGRESAQAAAWHIPVGVFMFGLAGAISSIVGGLRR
jgi:hypothetical protein